MEAGGITAQFSTFLRLKSAFSRLSKCEFGRAGGWPAGRLRYGVDPGNPRGANYGGHWGPQTRNARNVDRRFLHTTSRKRWPRKNLTRLVSEIHAWLIRATTSRRNSLLSREEICVMWNIYPFPNCRTPAFLRGLELFRSFLYRLPNNLRRI